MGICSCVVDRNEDSNIDIQRIKELSKYDLLIKLINLKQA